MKPIISWLNDRSGLFDRPGRSQRSGFWPWALLFCFGVQAISGFFLWVYYSPSAGTAWESVYFLQRHVSAGWLLRAIHHYSAHVLLALLIIYIVWSILTRVCRAPGELVFWSVLGLGLFALAAVLTGDLLAWDQNGYAATKTRVGFLNFLPLVGDGLFRLAIGGPGPELGSLTLTRFFALHVGLFGGGFLFLLIVHHCLVRRAGIASPRGFGLLGGLACLMIMAAILTLAAAGAPLHSPADVDPANQYAAARPEWFLTGVYEFSHLALLREYPIVPIFIVPGLIVCVMLAMPFIAARRAGHIFNVAFTVVLLASVAGLTFYSYAKDRADPEHQRAIALERRRAERLDELIRRDGIPPGGALELLRNDPKTQGPRLFAEQCAACHAHSVAGGDPLDDIHAADPCGPNLGGFADREWLAGLLDPRQVAGEKYFGNTRFRAGKMVEFVKETLDDLDEEEKENLAKVIAALSAEACLPAQREIDARDARLIAEGRKLISDDFGCTSCHKFHDKGALGTAPMLTGYGSPEWVSGIVCDPSTKQFYGESNDQMPAYAPAAEDSTDNLLSRRQIELLTDWLRGRWYIEGLGTRGEGLEDNAASQQTTKAVD